MNYIASLGKAEAAKTIVWLALFSIAVDVMENEVLTGQSEALSPVGKVNIPASGFATKPLDDECDGTEEVTESSVSPVVLRNFVLRANLVTALMSRLRLSRGNDGIVYNCRSN